MREMIKRATLLGAIMALTLAGCGDDSGSRTRDAGITLMDSGSTAMDSSTTPMDSGTTMDSGSPTGACAAPAPTVPASALPRCAAATLTCLMGCADGACQQACVDADTTAMDATTGLDCGGCLNAVSIQCADVNGCHGDYAGANCCIEANSCTDQACVTANCGTEVGAFQTCATGTQTACQSTVLGCFPAP
jgi:hypothetical protein